MIKTTIMVEGMMCSMCESHICEAIRRAVPTAKKVVASRHKKEASFLTEESIDTERIRAVIDETGYICMSVETVSDEKK